MKIQLMKSGLVVGFALVILLIMFQINLTAISRQHTTRSYWKRSQGRLSVKSMSQEDPQNQPRNAPVTIETAIRCDRSRKYYDVCALHFPAVFDPAQSTFYLMGATDKNQTNVAAEKVKPYPTKWEGAVMGRIKEITLAAGPSSPPCMVHHNLPALVFNAGGYTGNFFHEFNEGFIPLFVTASTTFRDSDFVMVISGLQDWWVSKYEDLLSSFTEHPVIDLDHEKAPHCFSSVTVGLVSHGFMTIDPKLMPNSETIRDFRALLETTYSRNTSYMARARRHRPLLLLVVRGGANGRAILNQRELQFVANKTGFRVTVFEPTANASLQQSYALVNSSHAMVGVHGAGLTHFLFLRPGAVFIQIVPIGPEDVADICYGKPARDLGLEYMEYKIGVKESSLINKHNRSSGVLRSWSKEFVNLYMKEQNVKLDLARFSRYLKTAYRVAKRFMKKNG